MLGREQRRGRDLRARSRFALSGLLVFVMISTLAAGVAVGGRATATQAQDAGLDTAAFAPETSLMYAAINLDQSSAQYSQATTLLDRAGLSSLLQQTADDAVADADMGDDLGAILGGEVGFVVNSVAGAEGLDLGSVVSGDVESVTSSASSGFGAVIRSSDPDAAFASIQEDLQSSATENGAEIESVEYEGVTIESASGVSEDDGAETSMALARVDDYILFAQIAADLEPLIDAQAGRVPSLAGSDNLAAVQDQLNSEYLLFAFINGPGFKDAVTTATDAQTETLLGDGILAAFDAYTGLVVWADAPGFRLDTISVPTTGAAPSNLMGNFDATLDERVPGDTILFASGQDLGASGLLDGIALLFAMGATGMIDTSGDASVEASPEATDPDEVLEEAGQLLGFNLQTDFIDQMTGEFGLAVSLTNLLSPDGIGAIFVSGVDDPTILADSVSKIALLVAAAVGGETEYSTREVGDTTVNVVEDDSGTLPVRVEYGVVEGEFMLAFGNLLQTYVDGPDETLAENPQYQEVMALLPAEHGAALYVDLSQIIGIVEALFGSFSESGITDASPDCGPYETQAAAQAAYDEDPGGLIDLDQDFDGEACEDFFVSAAATPDATPEVTGFSAITALATVAFQGDGVTGTSTILYISE